MKQTAVEYLYETIDNELIDFLDNRIDLNELSVAMLKVKAKAKEMEKEQIVDAFDEGSEYEYQYHINSTPKFDSQTYYNETYGGEL